MTPSRRSLHPIACDAAVIVRLAQALGRRDEAEHYLFLHQKELAPDNIEEVAKQFGVEAAFRQEYDKTIALVKADVEKGRLANITGTPTYFLNGIRIADLNASELDRLIRNEVSR